MPRPGTAAGADPPIEGGTSGRYANNAPDSHPAENHSPRAKGGSYQEVKAGAQRGTPAGAKGTAKPEPKGTPGRSQRGRHPEPRARPAGAKGHGQPVLSSRRDPRRMPETRFARRAPRDGPKFGWTSGRAHRPGVPAGAPRSGIIGR